MTDRTGRQPDQDVPGLELLRVTVGSHAHGTARPDSDRDERVIFAIPTENFFDIEQRQMKQAVWTEGGGDDGKLDTTGYEIGRFLKLATRCNPTVLEVFWAPAVSYNMWGDQLIGLRRDVLDRQRIFDAFSGYSRNQQKKMLADATWTPHHWKFATAMLRVLAQGITLLTDKELVIDFSVGYYQGDKEMHEVLMSCREGRLTPGEVVDHAVRLRHALFSAYNTSSLPVNPDLTEAQRFINRLRSEMFYR